MKVKLFPGDPEEIEIGVEELTVPDAWPAIEALRHRSFHGEALVVAMLWAQAKALRDKLLELGRHEV